MCDIAILSPRSRCHGDAWVWHGDEWAEGAGFYWTEPTLNAILCIMGWTRTPPHSHRCLPASSPARIPHTPAQIPLPPPPLHQTSRKSCSISKPVVGGISSLGRHHQTTPTILSTGLHGDPVEASSSALSARFRHRDAPAPPPNHVSLLPHPLSPLSSTSNTRSSWH